MGAVHTGLAADAAVNLGEKRRRNLNEGHAAQQDAGREACEVADDPATERHQRGRPLDPAAKNVLQHASERRQVFAVLAGIDDRVGAGEARVPQGAEGRVEIKLCDNAVGDHDRGATGEDRRQQVPRLTQEVGTHQHVVAARAKLHTHRLAVGAGSRLGIGCIQRGQASMFTGVGSEPGSLRCVATCVPIALSTASTVCSCGPSMLSMTTSASA